MKNFIKKNRTIAITLVVMMIIIAGSVIYIGIVKADSFNQLKAVQTQADADIKKLNESKSTSENDLKTAQAEIEKLNSKIDELEKKLSDAELQMEMVGAETTDKKVTATTPESTGNSGSNAQSEALTKEEQAAVTPAPAPQTPAQAQPQAAPAQPQVQTDSSRPDVPMTEEELSIRSHADPTNPNYGTGGGVTTTHLDW